MNYASIRTCDIANGEGVRVSLFVSGCTHHCKGCFNEAAWDFAYGEPFTKKTENEILAALEPDFIDGLTLLGGEPMEPENQRALMPLLRRFREKFGDAKTLWIYTGCVLETDLKAESRWRTEVTDEMLSLTDVLVDGPFLEAKKDISLQFRGSSNQALTRRRRRAWNSRGFWPFPPSSATRSFSSYSFRAAIRRTRWSSRSSRST